MDNEKKKKEVQDKLKKMLVYALMGLVCAGVLWWIFKPSAKDQAKENQQIGLNTQIPEPMTDVIIDNKKRAFEQERVGKNPEERMFSLDEYSKARKEGKEEKGISQSPSPGEESLVESSVNAYKEVNQTLENFFTATRTHEEDQEILELKWRIQELERLQQEKEEEQRTFDHQIALMEKSYELANRYASGEAHSVAGNSTAYQSRGSSQGEPEVSNEKKGISVTTLITGENEVVSSLRSPANGFYSLDSRSTPSNGFNTLDLGNQTVSKNTIRACINKDQSLINGQHVVLRLLEPIWVDQVRIPANHLLTGQVKLTGERLEITVSAIEYGGRIMDVHLTVKDLDGGKGIYIPGSEELDAMKEVLANMGNTIGTSISITDNFGSELAADLTKSMIQGTSKYFQKKVQMVRVHIKAGYQVYLQSNDV